MAEDQGDSMVNGTKNNEIAIDENVPAGEARTDGNCAQDDERQKTREAELVVVTCEEYPSVEGSSSTKEREEAIDNENTRILESISSTSTRGTKCTENSGKDCGTGRSQDDSVERVPDSEEILSEETSSKKDKTTSQDSVGTEERLTNVQKSETNIDAIISEEERKLNKILKSVRSNDVAENKDLRGSCGEQEKDDNDDDEAEEEEEEKEIVDDNEQNDNDAQQVMHIDEMTSSDAKEEENDDEAFVDTSLVQEGQKTEAEEEESAEDSRPSEDRRIELTEVGIVGPPTAVSELINEEELRTESTLPTEEKLQDHVAEWVQNTARAEDLTIGAEETRSRRSGEEVERKRRRRRRKRTTTKKKTRKSNEGPSIPVPTRKSQRIVSNIIKKSIKCLNKMHAMDGTGGNGKRPETDKIRESHGVDVARGSTRVPLSQQNGAALPEETATTADQVRPPATAIKKEPVSESEPDSADVVSELTRTATRTIIKSDGTDGRKRRSSDEPLTSNGGNAASKRACLEQREQFITSLVGNDKASAEELAARADQLRAEVQALDELARAKEMEWNEILSMRKLKEEAYLRLERRRQVVGFMEGNGELIDSLPPASLALDSSDWDNGSASVKDNKIGYGSLQDGSPPSRKDKIVKLQPHRQSSSPKLGESGRKQAVDSQNLENRQIGEGRQGPIVDVRSIIADYRLRHPETVPRRGRRMRNSVNVGLGAGGAMVETGHTVDSRPSSTDSCKSNPNAADPNSSMSFKDVLVQFAKLSQQQGEPVKTPQNYPDVTLHPVAPSPSPQNAAPQQTGSLLHGILTKSQSPRPTTFSPTLARLLTAPERERNTTVAASTPQQNATTQHLLQAYQGSNPVFISDLLSSSKARTEITITPVVNTSVQSHSNSLVHVDDVEEETTVIEERGTRASAGVRDNREEKDNPPRCQGCHERAAQFVCAGCGNQWYCSRECQVSAWDDHSEVCSG